MTGKNFNTTLGIEPGEFDTLAECKRVVRAAMIHMGVSPSCVDVRFSKRLTNSMGRGGMRRGRGVVTLSAVLWPKARPDERLQTTIHEACHAALVMRSGTQGSGHGAAWRAAMRFCGVRPVVCHSVDIGGHAQCRCRVHSIGPRKIRQAGTTGELPYCCRFCGSRLMVVKQTSNAA